ncbi:Alpha/Beta hydrolase protein [Xylogone sp. PMI_703]|nr:Alpha/Beta hydrolase protein [Xylogone sp. PMI_703]
MYFTLAISLLLQFCLPTATAYRYFPPNGNCVDYDILVSISTEVATWNATKWNDDFGVVDFVSFAATRTSAGLPPPITGPSLFEGQFTIAATFCSPNVKASPHHKTVLLATHGLGFDRGYWNSQYQPEDYNFAQYILNKGYSIFFYDRLGVGASSSLSGFVNQASIQVEILRQLADFIRHGKYTDHLGVPDHVVLLGHSFGSFISTALLAGAPTSADAAILTGLGFSLDSAVQIESLNLRMASAQDQKWAHLDAGYLTWNDIFGNINNFLKAPTYTFGAAVYSEASKAPIGVLEVLSIQSLNFNATRFRGPTLVMNGEFDFLVCGGFCPGVMEEPATTFFSGSKGFRTYIQPQAGHALNFHQNATAGYEVIANYLHEHGL